MLLPEKYGLRSKRRRYFHIFLPTLAAVVHDYILEEIPPYDISPRMNNYKNLYNHLTQVTCISDLQLVCSFKLRWGGGGGGGGWWKPIYTASTIYNLK